MGMRSNKKANRDGRTVVAADGCHHLRIIQTAIRSVSAPHLPKDHPKTKNIEFVVHFRIGVSFGCGVLWGSFVKNERLCMTGDFGETEVGDEETIVGAFVAELRGRRV